MASNQSLFRKQATDYSTGRLKGDVLVKPRVSHILISIVSFLWVAVICYLIANFSYQKAIVVEAVTFTKNSQTMATIYLSSDIIKNHGGEQYFQARVKGTGENWPLELRLTEFDGQYLSGINPSASEFLLTTARVSFRPETTSQFEIEDNVILEVKIDQRAVNLMESLFAEDAS